MKNVIDDARTLVSKLEKSISPSNEWKIVSVAKTSKKIKLPRSLAKLDWFQYSHEDTLDILVKHGVIKGVTYDWWFLGFKSIDSLWGRNRPEELAVDDGIVHIAQKVRLIRKDQIIEYYYVIPSDDRGPQPPGLASILVNREQLKNFKKTLDSLKVMFNDNDSCLEFLGESLQFKKMEKECVKLLIKNLNKPVSYKDFYEVRDGSYTTKAIEQGKSDADEPSRAMFKRIRAKIYKNKKLKQVLLLSESVGFKMKVNRDALEKFLLI